MVPAARQRPEARVGELFFFSKGGKASFLFFVVEKMWKCSMELLLEMLLLKILFLDMFLFSLGVMRAGGEACDLK